MAKPAEADQNVYAITRPASSLLTYYTIISSPALLLCLPWFLAFPPLLFKYHTLRYRFDNEGVSMSWGLLFRREINLTYARIQDIHVSRNVVERWLGLATVGIQTASGSAAAEMSIQGIPQFEQLRDFLYARMRGNQEEAETEGTDVLELLAGIRDDLSAVRAVVESRDGEG